jgi:hypothetical protein
MARRIQQTRTPHPCVACGRLIAAGESCYSAMSLITEWVCNSCAGDVPPEPVARIVVQPDVMQVLMDGAADELTTLGARVAVIAIRFDDELADEEIHELSRAWAAKISEKRVVDETRVRVYAAARPVSA